MKKIGFLLFFLVIILVACGENDKDTYYYVSPDGSGHACTKAVPCSLISARDKVREVNQSMLGDIYVYLLGGTYSLTSTFTLTAQDSGSNSFSVIYKNVPEQTPILSGGQTITNWSLYDKTQNIYKAHVGMQFQIRQLYVNGIRAIRARGEMDPSGFSKTSSGYTLPIAGLYAGMSSWNQLADVEIVSFTNWRSYRCGVSTVEGAALAMDSVCWLNSQRQEAMKEPKWIENAYELLDNEREWYLDRTNGDLYYKPSSNEQLASISVIAPVLEKLISVEGDLSKPVHHITIKGLTFSYATWLRPSTEEGYVPLQAGYLYYGPDGGASDRDKIKTLSHLDFRAVNHIRLEQNIFTHLGGAALSFEWGSQDNEIIGNSFVDISSHAIQIGNINDNEAKGAAIVKNNLIQNNFITTIGQEYEDAVGIFVGYTDGTNIDHNEITDIPYTGISIGWGWSDKSYESMRNNRVTYNSIHNFMNKLMDGGGIYTLGRQDQSVIVGNYIYDNHNEYGSIYLDQGTTGYTISNNLLVNNFSNWIFVQNNVKPFASGNTISNNYMDTTVSKIFTGNTVQDNVVISSRALWPRAAESIINQAGILEN
jgi:hypothetical protein